MPDSTVHAATQTPPGSECDPTGSSTPLTKSPKPGPLASFERKSVRGSGAAVAEDGAPPGAAAAAAVGCDDDVKARRGWHNCGVVAVVVWCEAATATPAPAPAPVVIVAAPHPPTPDPPLISAALPASNELDPRFATLPSAVTNMMRVRCIFTFGGSESAASNPPGTRARYTKWGAGLKEDWIGQIWALGARQVTQKELEERQKMQRCLPLLCARSRCVASHVHVTSLSAPDEAAGREHRIFSPSLTL
jgi:hypothetical protein